MWGLFNRVFRMYHILSPFHLSVLATLVIFSPSQNQNVWLHCHTLPLRDITGSMPNISGACNYVPHSQYSTQTDRKMNWHLPGTHFCLLEHPSFSLQRGNWIYNMTHLWQQVHAWVQQQHVPPCPVKTVGWGRKTYSSGTLDTECNSVWRLGFSKLH